MGKGGSERKQGGTVMSEDALVNTGAAGWPSFARAYVAVRRMQTKLHGWAATDGGRQPDGHRGGELSERIMCRVRQVVVKVYGVATTMPQG